MHLKKLEIHGFKSFADKTKFVFSNGITVIVGPNGSGKSNIADAIRWVLGEQSIKTLRGGKIEDIIFAGAKNRKPLGMAEVSLVLDNETGLFPIAFSDVKVTRRVYRSGESEYLINDSPCRLKDIHDLFADSGLGKDALAIVGQGKIDEILSVRSEDRRGLIEEAAGITRYRTRKKEAERKLHNTERDLERISDILYTLEERIGPLSNQKLKAEQYIKLSSELNELELQLLLQQLNDADTRKQKLQEKLSCQKGDMTLKETEVRTLEAEIEEKRLLLIKEEEQIALLQQNLFNVTTEWEKTSGELKLTEEKVIFIDEKISGHNTQIEKLHLAIKELDEKKQLITLSLDDKVNLNQEKSKLLKELENLKNEKIKQVQGLEAKLEDKKNTAFEAAQQLSTAKNTLANFSKNKELTAHKILVVKEKANALQSQYDYLKNQYSEQKIAYAKLTDNFKQLSEQETEFKKELQLLQQRQAQLSATILEKNTNAESTRKQHAFYVEMENKHEGYGHAVRALLDPKNQANHHLNNIHGTVAEVISLESKYETAIETALGAAIQNVIVETEVDASNSIEFLKKNNLGRATFLPLTVIKGERISNLKYRIASELVSTNDKYQSIIEHLLGRTIVAETMKDAIEAARDTKHRYKIVTLDGEVFFPGGSISGGSSPKKQTSFLARKRLIAELAKKADELREETQVLRRNAEDNISKLKQNEQKLVDLANNKTLLLADLSTSDKEIALKMQSLEAIEKEIQDKIQEHDYLEADEKIITKEINSAEVYLEAKQEAYAQVSKDVEDITSSLRSIRLENETDTNDLLELKTDVARLEEEIKSKRQELEGYSSDILSKSKDIEHLKLENDSLNRDRNEKLSQINSLNETLLVYSNKRTELENLVQNAKESKQQKHMECFEDEQKLKVLQKQLSVLSTDIHLQEVKLAKIEVETEALNERLTNDFAKTFPESQGEIKPNFDKKTSQERIMVLQHEISLLGTVNTGAIEEYLEVTERLAFLNDQQKDLTDAKDSLFKVIKEIEKEMCTKFLETFDAVNKEFQIIFQQIFNGGTAKLTLTDELNLLESGIDIIAQPPGKRLQHIMLLSGGEKALTAIALLFAILRIKPAPFCVLDEIEAALDEANVERFASFLKDYAQKTQFIIISHRQGTMEVADTLYGTTMEESGVTKLISVKFDERMVG